jgi:FOG: Ankyrin repeat
VNARNSRGETPLHCAAGSGHSDVVRLLLERGADPEARDVSGRTPDSYALEAGYTEVVLLIEKFTGKLGGARGPGA